MSRLQLTQFALLVCVLLGLVKVAGHPGRCHFRALASSELTSVMRIRSSHIATSELSIDRQSLVYYHETMSWLALRIANLRGEPQIDLMNSKSWKSLK